MPASDSVSPPVILGNEPGSFPWSVLAERHPALIQQVRDAFPYGPEQHRALDALLEELHRRRRRTAPRPAPRTGRSGRTGDREPRRAGPGSTCRSCGRRATSTANSSKRSATSGPGPGRASTRSAPSSCAELDAPETDERTGRARRPRGGRVEEQDAGAAPRARCGATGPTSASASPAGRAAGTAAGPLVADDSDAALAAARRPAPPHGVPGRRQRGPGTVPDLLLLDHLLRTGRRRAGRPARQAVPVLRLRRHDRRRRRLPAPADRARRERPPRDRPPPVVRPGRRPPRGTRPPLLLRPAARTPTMPGDLRAEFAAADGRPS